MATLSTVALALKEFYRLVGTTTSDDALVEQGESADDVAYLCLTHGAEAAQRFMIARGMSERWRARSQAITSWSGADATDGGRYKAMSGWIAASKDFLRFAGQPYDAAQSSLVEADGTRWGVEVEPDKEYIEGDYYYLKNDELWLTRKAAPPATLYVEYQFKHPEVASGSTLNLPTEARGLMCAYGARFGSMQGWFPRADTGLIERNVTLWEGEARSIARRSRGPRTMTAPKVVGHRYFA